MYSKPRGRGNIHVYRLRWGYRRLILRLDTFFIILIPFMMYGYSLNSKEGFVIDAAVYIGSLALIAALFWFTLQVGFIFRLETNPDKGTLYGFGKTIVFGWQDIQKLDYVLLTGDNKYQLCLFLHRSDVKHSFIFPFPRGWFAIHFSERIIPVNSLYKYQSFFSLNIKRELPNFNDRSIHLRYFVKTQLGQDLMRYAPHIFEAYLHKYLPDNDLEI